MIKFPKGEKRGQWQPMTTQDGEAKASIRCPECGHIRFITKQRIARDGTVMPSVVCACGCGCKFHQHIQLEDWEA